jgi:hypothetical protein
MCWGFECGDGWFNIIDVLCRQIQNYVDGRLSQQDYLLKTGQITSAEVKTAAELQVTAEQVKEKFGMLRIYTNSFDEQIVGMIKMAEAMSSRTCEDCGGVGSPRKGGWIRTLCDSCNDTWKSRKTASWAVPTEVP